MRCQREGGEEKDWLRAGCESELCCDPVQQRKLQFNLLMEYLNLHQLYKNVMEQCQELRFSMELGS